MKLPNAENAFVDIEKIRNYCLNQTHERGKHKARLFASILGVTVNDSKQLQQFFLNAAKTYDAQESTTDQYGKRYSIDFQITTMKGQAQVRTTWIILLHENFARLTSCYILKKRAKK